jgi:hypothetical protein
MIMISIIDVGGGEKRERKMINGKWCINGGTNEREKMWTSRMVEWSKGKSGETHGGWMRQYMRHI